MDKRPASANSLEDIMRRHKQWESQESQFSSLSSPPDRATPPMHHHNPSSRAPRLEDGVVHLHKRRSRHTVAPPAVNRATEAPPSHEARFPLPPSSFLTASPAGSASSPPEDTRRLAPPAAARAPFSMPFTPYPVQDDMMRAISDTLLSTGVAATPVVATEVPTGCGKTMALLSSVLRYQAAVKRMTPREAEMHFTQRAYRGFRVAEHAAQRSTSSRRGRGGGGRTGAALKGATSVGARKGRQQQGAEEGDAAASEDDGWTVPPAFFKQFRVDRAKRLRVEVDPTGSSELRRRFVPPPCTIFYATRTHAQLSQVVRELRRLVEGGGTEAAGAATMQGASSTLSTDASPPASSSERGWSAKMESQEAKLFAPPLHCPPLRMNILGSRERYCINPTVRRATANHTLPNEGNNLGEVCDKLVSLGQCECVHGYGELACSAIDGCAPVGSQKLPQKKHSKAANTVWDLEDLVMEGVAQQACPYYAARDLVFYADITFCTYNYLLDPLIRLECNMESAIKNNTIVVLDEAHNVPDVCQEALSVSAPMHVLKTILAELNPLASGRVPVSDVDSAASGQNVSSHPDRQQQTRTQATTSAYLSYQRDFKLTQYSLGEIFAFLFTLFHGVETYFSSLPVTGPDGEEVMLETEGTSNAASSSSTKGAEEKRKGTSLAKMLSQRLSAFVEDNRHLHQKTSPSSSGNSGEGTGNEQDSAFIWLPLFKNSYALIMALGVTFNPFNLSIFALSLTKRWLLILRFLLLKPDAFALARTRVRPSEPAKGAAAAAAAVFPATADPPVQCEIRCLDGSLAFHHLLRSTHRVVLASGTLAPFSQLAADLGLSLSSAGNLEAGTGGGGRHKTRGPVVVPPFCAFDGPHVVGPDRYVLRALTKLPPAPTARGGPATSSVDASPCTADAGAGAPLHCTFGNLGSLEFLRDLAHTVYRLSTTVPAGGVLVFAPNYRVMEQLCGMVKALVEKHNTSEQRRHKLEVLAEPRKAPELPAVLDYFKAVTTTGAGSRSARQDAAVGIATSGLRKVAVTAILFSVYRGKVSEGIDFTDSMARLVLCIGVPLQPLKSWTVKAQRSYSGPEWYTTDAVRAVNQALGRCLRHINDYGAVVLLDDRYAEPEVQRRLSRWCRDAMVVDESVSVLVNDLVAFFAALGDGGAEAGIPGRPEDEATAVHDDGAVVEDGVNPVTVELGTTGMPFQRILRTTTTPAGTRSSKARTHSSQHLKTDTKEGMTGTLGRTHGEGAVTCAKTEEEGERKQGTARSPSPLPPSANASAASPAPLPLHRHPWSATALKLLSEEAGVVTQGHMAAKASQSISAEALRARLQELERVFME